MEKIKEIKYPFINPDNKLKITENMTLKNH